MSYRLTSAAIEQSGINLELFGTATTLAAASTLGRTGALMTFNSATFDIQFDRNIGFSTLQGIVDNNQNELILFTVAGATQITHLNISNGATGVAPRILATGEAAVDLDIDPTGAGSAINFGAQNAAGATAVRIWEGGAGVYNGFETAATQITDIDYTWPDAAPTATNTTLTATAAGVMSWAPDAGGLDYQFLVAATGTAALNQVVGVGNVTAACAIALTTATANGQIIRVIDVANTASTNNITLTCGGTDVFAETGAATYVINSDFESITLSACTSTAPSVWSII